MPKDKKKVAVIGFGAMARSLCASLKKSGSDIEVCAALVPADLHFEHEGIEFFSDVADLVKWQPSVVVECASHEAVRQSVPPLLRSGIDVIVVSLGSLGDADLFSTLKGAADVGGAKLTVASGAIGGLDVLRSARVAGLDNVIYTGVKPPAAWKDTPADTAFDLGNLRERTVIFEGSAADASARYPKNANVTAAVALAGVGFNDTKVTLIADPAASGNSHTVNADGAFGRFQIILENKPLPDNPKTSWLAALSVEQALHRQFQSIEL